MGVGLVMTVDLVYACLLPGVLVLLAACLAASKAVLRSCRGSKILAKYSIIVCRNPATLRYVSSALSVPGNSSLLKASMRLAVVESPKESM